MFNDVSVSAGIADGVDVAAGLNTYTDTAPEVVKKSSAPITIKPSISNNINTQWIWPLNKTRPLAAEMPTFVKSSASILEENEHNDEKNDNSESKMDCDDSTLPGYRRVESRAVTSAAIAAIERSLGMSNGFPEQHRPQKKSPIIATIRPLVYYGRKSSSPRTPPQIPPRRSSLKSLSPSPSLSPFY